jgi:deoxyribodipyrimidine photolyase-like uncharacterized protein
MTRYIVISNGMFVAGAQPDTKHVWYTDQREDAGEWVTYERAVKAAKFVQELTGNFSFIQAVETEKRPKSWNVVAK